MNRLHPLSIGRTPRTSFSPARKRHIASSTAPRSASLQTLVVDLYVLWLAVLLGLVGLYGFFVLACSQARCSDFTVTFLNFIGQSTLLASVAFVVYRLVRRDANLLWTPIVVFPVSTALYFGFGNMAIFFADDATQAFFAIHAYGIDVHELLLANLLTSVGLFCAAGGILFVASSKSLNALIVASVPPDRFSLDQLASVFLIFGIPFYVFFLAPARFGHFEWTMPGILNSFRHLADIGFFLLAYSASRGSRRARFFFWLVWPLYFAVGLLEFSKKVAMIAILLPAVGAFMAHRSISRSIPWLVAAALCFAAFQPINTLSRAATGSDDAGAAGLTERFDVILNAAGLDDSLSLPSLRVMELQVWWLRLSYAGAQIRGMELYDQGMAGQWYQSPLMYFVPRLLWPDKPRMVSPGQIFNRQITGIEDATTRVGMTVYGGGYWQMGWLGVVLFSAIMGVVFGLISQFSYAQMSRGAYVFLPVVLLGAQTAGLGPTGYLQNSILGALSIYVASSLVIHVACRLLPSAPASKVKGRLAGRRPVAAPRDGVIRYPKPDGRGVV